MFIIAALCLVLFISHPVGAEEVPVPATVQVPIFLKILTFDRNFEQRVGSQLRIGIVYTDDDPASLQVTKEVASVLASFAKKTIRHLPITYVLLPFTREQNVMEFAKSQGINVFYIAPGITKHLAALLQISQKLKIITVTGVPRYVEKGAAVGIGLTSDNKARILINLDSSQLEGAAFDANLLRLATVLQGQAEAAGSKNAAW